MKYDEMFIKSPFSPVSVRETDADTTMCVWGREYKMDKRSPLFSSITSQGENVLAAPIRVVMEENGEPSNWSEPMILKVDGDDPTSQTVCATMSSDSFYINTTSTVEFDGVTKIQLRIMPRGYTVREVFVYNERKLREFHLDKLWIEIPIKKSSAVCYQVFPRCAVTNEAGEEIKPNSPLATGDFIHKGTACFPFLSQFFVTGEKTGLGVMLESNERWQPIDPTRSIECIETEDAVVLRLRLLDSHPDIWEIRGGKYDINFNPITFEFGLQVTPFKQYPSNPYLERCLHIDCGKKIENDYEEYLSVPFVKDNGVNTGEIGFDRLKRLGVNTLYLHEKWNDFQNSTILSQRSANRLRFIIDECHKRGIKVIPYFGYEISSLSPEWGERVAEICIRKPNGKMTGMWNRVPFQRCANVCCNSSIVDTFPKGIAALMDTFGFDGIYLDGTATPRLCANEVHGCGYTDRDGVRHGTYPIWGTRKMFVELYKVVHERGGFMNFHTAGCYNLTSLALCDSIWEGEVTQFALFNQNIGDMPEGIYRGQFDGRIFGLPLFMLAYTKDLEWTHEHSTAFASLFGTIHKPNDADEPLESTSRMWNVIDQFPIEGAEWHPYWHDDSLVKSNHETVKVSYYKNGNRLLVFAANTRKEVAKGVTLSANGAFHGAINTSSVSENITPIDNIEEFGYRVYFVDLK